MTTALFACVSEQPSLLKSTRRKVFKAPMRKKFKLDLQENQIRNG
jgi:hypothetical protein